MDNLTHSLVGLAVAEATHQKLPAQSRTCLYAVSLLANNLPDFDILYAPWMLEGKLGYLLHHRGHTHTLVAAVVFTLLCLGIPYLYGKLRNLNWTKQDWRGFLWVSALGPLIHIGLDALNNYGVHPFWPFNNRWIYGDAVFIVEPLFWLALAPCLAFAAKQSWKKMFYFVTVGAGLGLIIDHPFVPMISKIVYPFLCLVLFFITWKLAPHRRAFFGLGTSLMIIFFFIGTSKYVKAQVLPTKLENLTYIEVGANPHFGNPFCWSIIRSSISGQEFHLKSGVLNLLSTRFPKLCDSMPAWNGTARMSSVTKQDQNSDIQWRNELHRTVNQLRDAQKKSCTFRNLLHFARFPFWHLEDNQLIAGDIRYDRSPEIGFAETKDLFERPCKIPPLIPWKTPLQEHLGHQIGSL